MALSLKVTHKLLLSFTLVALLVAGLGYLAFVTSGWVGERVGALDADALSEVEHLHGMAFAAQAAQAAVHEIAGTSARADSETTDPAATAREALGGQIAAFERHLAHARTQATARGDQETLARLGPLAQAFDAYKEMATRYADLSRSAPAEAALVLDAEIGPHYFGTLAPALARQVETAQAALADRSEAAVSAATWTGRLGLAGAVLVFLVVVALGFTLTRFVSRSLGGLTSAALAIGEGRWSRRLAVTSEDEVGQLSAAINQMIEQISSTTVSKGYVENIVQSMADPLVVVDPNVQIAMVNQAALDLLGYERGELLGKPVTTIFALSGRDRGAVIKKTIEQGLAGNVETKFKAKNSADGDDIPVSLSSALVREGNDVQGLVIVAKDITERKRFEAELIEAKEKAEQMVHLRDAFLANMSHEIRTPLTGILGSAQVLAEVVQEGEQRNLAKIIEDAGTRLLDTINSVLEMARIEAGEVQPEVEILNLVEEAEASARVLATVAEKKGLLLRVHATDRNLYAQTDRSCLHRILNNLVGNAVKFTREGAVSVEVEGTEDTVSLTVRDTGVGIAKEFLPHLFDDFKQESTGLKRSHEGSGLGLAITKKLVEMMGGEITVESIKGIGSAFTATFPRVPMEQVPQAPAAGPSYAPRSVQPDGPRYPWETATDASAYEEPPQPTFAPPPAPEERTPRDILMIEDNAQNAYMAQFMLRDYATDIATTPEEAIDKVLHHQYRVLLVDINLGADRSGIDLLHEMRGIEGYEFVPAVAVTAYALPGDEERFITEGFDNYVAKPFRKERLIEAVELALTPPPEDDTPKLESLLGGSFEDFDGSVVIGDDSFEPVTLDAAHDLDGDGAGGPHPAAG